MCAVLAIVAVMMALPSFAQAQQHFDLKNGQWQQQKTYPPDSPQGKLQTIRQKLAQDQGDDAEDLANQWLKEYPGSALRAQALLLLGDAKVTSKHYYDALYDYEALIRQYPASDAFKTALQREYEIARLFVHGMKRLFLGMRILPAKGEGEEILIRIQERAPGSEIGETASMELADYYYREDNMPNAAVAYDSFLQNYPDSPKRQWAMLRLIQANLAQYKGPGFDPTGLLNAQARLKDYQKEFPAAAEKIGAKALSIRIQESLALDDLKVAHWYAEHGEDVSVALLDRRLVKQYPQTAAAKLAIEQLKKMHAAVVANTTAESEESSTPPATQKEGS